MDRIGCPLYKLCGTKTVLVVIVTCNCDIILNEPRAANSISTTVDCCKELSCKIHAFGIITVYDNMHIREDSTQTANGEAEHHKPES